MTKYLSNLLGVPESEFNRRILLLENASLQTGIDIRITTEIRSELIKKLRGLGLDPKDTTAEELYHALRVRAIQDDQVLQKKLGIKPDASSVQTLTAIAAYFSKNTAKQKAWSIKKTALKKLLKDIPPHKTMKVLRYRSEVSMLKREQVTDLYALACLLEGDSYLHKIMQAMKRMRPSDFEERSLEVICFTEKRWTLVSKSIKKQTIPVFSVPEVNAIVVLPVTTQKTSCLALLSAALVLKEMRRVKEHASYLKIKTLDPQLHLHVQIIAAQGHIPLFTLHGEQVYWHHVHRILGRRHTIPDELGPHMDKKDLEWINIEASLADIS